MWTFPDMKERILKLLPRDFPWRESILYLPTVDSTNTRLKALAREGAPHGTILLADHQTGGRGRLGRQFHSPAGSGIYMSALLRPECPPEELMHLTCAVAVAMTRALEQAAGLEVGIKWTNDLVFGRRKLGGILTELGLSGTGSLDYAILGVGINCHQRQEDFPPELRETATSLALATGAPVCREKIAAAMMENLFAMDETLLTRREDTLMQYRQRCVTLGQEISLVRGDTLRHGRALDIDPQGALIVEFAPGVREAVNSGEVSVRGMYGYV